MRRAATVLSACVAAAVAAVVLVPAASASASARHRPAVRWADHPIAKDVRLRGLAAVSDRVAWVSGASGTVERTTDGGRHWVDVSPGGDTSTLDFRDIEATDARHAVALSIGEGSDSRIYRTVDGGAHWDAAFVNDDANAFYDCLSFFAGGRDGLALSDPVDGRFRLLRTHDGGAHWAVQDPAGMPAALAGEFAFAASGTCLITAGHRDAWIASGGGASTRVYHSVDGGRHFSVVTTPIASGDAAGIFSLAARGPLLAAVGGDYTAPTGRDRIAATSYDAGRHFVSARVMPGGYRSGAAWLGRRGFSLVAVGPTGSDLSTDAGRTWTTFETGSLDNAETAPDGATWASGEHGRVAVLTGCR